MTPLLRTFLALASLLGAFYLSISYRYGDPGWRLSFSPASTAEARGTSGAIDGYDLGSLSILNRAVIHIKENYVDPDRIDERRMLGAAMEEVQRAVAEMLVDVERDAKEVPTRLTVRINGARKSFDLTDVGNLWQMSFKFKDIFRFTEANLKHHQDLRDIEYAAINGMLSTLDPHSVLLRPEDYREMKLSTRGKFGGLGIVISVRDGQLTIVNPIEDTPASRAGLKAGDRITQIGLDSTVNMALSDAVDMLRGAPNTEVDIWVLREGWSKPRKFTLTRADIKVKSVAWKMLDGKVGVVRLRNFQNTTYDELKKALKAIDRKGRGRLSGLILDLRGNPGGLLDQAIKIADLFVTSGPLVTTVGFGDRMREPKMATRAGTRDRLPLAALTARQSASASEIVAGALQNHHRALVIGQKSFGKGSVQVIYDNKDDSALKLTIAQYLTPGDVSIQSVGITPDIETRPVTINDEGTDLFLTEDEEGGEVHLPEHLDHASAQVSKDARAAFSLEYLRDEALDRAIEESPNDIIVDFELDLARDLLVATDAPHREGMLADVEPALEGRRTDAEVRIADALDARGVDWRELSSPAPAGTARAAVTVTTDRPDGRVLAGETVTVTATVSNEGTGPFVRLRATSASDNPLLAGHEFVFGYVPPGESRTWTVPIKLPRSALTRRDEVKLSFVDDRGSKVPPRTIKVEVEQLERPRFALSWRLDDRATGNGDGVLQLGEVGELHVEARNVGEGESFSLLGALRNDEDDTRRGVFIERGRVEEDPLKPGETARFRFSFKVKAETPGDVPVMVSVYDSEIREGTTERVILPVLSKASRLEPIAERLAPASGDRLTLRGIKHAEAPGVAEGLGFVVADARLGEWYRVPTDSGHLWVDAEQVRPAGEGGADQAVRPVAPASPPIIALRGRQMPVETRDATLTVGGEVLGDRLVQDLLIYVNNKKVFFKANIGGDTAPAPFTFNARVPLEEGVNRITLVARENDEYASRRTVIVNRSAK